MSSTKRVPQEHLFLGKPILVDDICLIYPPTMGEVFDITYQKFQQYLGILTISKQIYGKDKELADMSELVYLIGNSMVNEAFQERLKEAFNFFIKEPVIVLPDLGAFLIGAPEDVRLLDDNSFPTFQSILRQVTGLESWTERGDDWFDDKAREIKEKIRVGQAKVREIKGESDEAPDLTDLVSAYSVETGIPFETIFQMPYAIFQKQYRRMLMRESYHTYNRAAMAGAKLTEENRKHWIRKIQD